MRTAVNLQGVEKESAPRGSVLSHPGTLTPTKSAEVSVRYLPLSPKPLRHRAQVSFHAGTFACVGRILLYGQAEIPPGGSGYGRVVLSEETVLVGSDRFILRGFSPLANFGYTIGGGTVIHPKPPARKGTGKAVPEIFTRLRSEDPAERVVAAVEDSGGKGADVLFAAAVAGIGEKTARSILSTAEPIVRGPGGTRFWHRKAVDEASASAVQALSRLHDRNPDREGFPREEVAALFPVAPDPALLSLAIDGNPALDRQGELYLLPARRPKAVELGTPLARKVAERIRTAGSNAPTRAELLEAVRPLSRDPRDVDKVVDGLARSGEVVRVKDLLFDAGALRGIQEKLLSFLDARGEITVPEFKELSGLTRKYTIPLLEHFDGAKITLRVGDKRVLRKGR
jgi:selenocysteine-specific elongation factor